MTTAEHGLGNTNAMLPAFMPNRQQAAAMFRLTKTVSWQRRLIDIDRQCILLKPTTL